jgi:excinuclease ABC subunit B
VLTRSYNVLVPKEKKQLIRALEEEMFELAKNLEFERAAVVRDEIRKIKEMSSTD